MRMFGLIGLILTLCAGAIIATRQMNKLSAMPPGVGLGQPSYKLQGGDEAGGEQVNIQKLPGQVQKKLQKINQKRQPIDE